QRVLAADVYVFPVYKVETVKGRGKQARDAGNLNPGAPAYRLRHKGVTRTGGDRSGVPRGNTPGPELGKSRDGIGRSPSRKAGGQRGQTGRGGRDGCGRIRCSGR